MQGTTGTAGDTYNTAGMPKRMEPSVEGGCFTTVGTPATTDTVTLAWTRGKPT